MQSKFHLRKHSIRCGSETVQKLLKAKELIILTVVLDTKHPASDEDEFANSAAALPAQKQFRENINASCLSCRIHIPLCFMRT
jgi:hypothetical protein